MITPFGSPFVGRDAELAALRERFATGNWVTVLGPGGMGKTRLASRFAGDARATGRAVCLVELGSALDLSRAVVDVARALEVELRARDLAETTHAVAARLGRSEPLLLVLDEVEAIADELAPHVARWASCSAAVEVLVTSRRALGGDGEQIFALEPLASDDAIALFSSRARAIRPDVRIDDSLVASIVDAIDRMPLAIELAASRLRVLSLVELARRLDAPLAVLRSSGDGRHTSIRRAVTDSLELLGPNERRVFVLVASLRDGFSLDDAEAVLAGGSAPEAVLDALDALVRTSLLRVRVDDSDRARYAYFSTVREVAAELHSVELDEAAREEVRLRASRHFARQTGVPREAELDNLVVAHRTAVERAIAARSEEHARDALALLARLETVLSAWGRSVVREALADATLDALDALDAASVERARVHLGRGLARKELGRTAAAREDFDVARALCGEDDGLRAVALIRLAALDDVASDTERARARLEEALRALERSPDDDVRRAREAEASLHLGHALRREGRLDDARAILRGAVARYRALADDPGLAASLYELAVVEIFASRPDASGVVEEGLAIARRAGDRRMEGTLTMARGCLLHERGELGAARAHHAEAARLFAELGDPHREASALFYLATTYVESRRIDDALALLARARANASEVGTPRYEALVDACTASAYALADRAAEAGAAIGRARRGVAHVSSEPALQTTVAVHGRVVDVLEGSLALADALDASESEVAKSSNDDSRFALRLLRSLAGAVRAGAVRAGDVLEIATDGSWFRSPNAERVSLPARSPLRRLLVCLATQRIEAPGRAVRVDELLAAGWPNEKMRVEAGLNRLYVAIATLRKRGLADAVVRSGGGYLLSPAVPIGRSDEPHSERADVKSESDRSDF